MNTKNPFLSIIIPLYNEESRLRNLSKIYKYLNNLNFDYEVLLVNDGSLDKTVQRLKQIYKKFKFQLISYDKNRGKGFAVRGGMLDAKGKYRLFTDIDLSTPIDQLNKFIPQLKKADILIGSRKTAGAHLYKRQSFIRENLGKGFTLLSRMILDLEISDFTCGFKCFSKKSSISIFSKQKIERWGFDSEILFIAKKLGFSIKEVPVNWSHDPRSKVRFPHDIISSLSDLYKIKYHSNV